MTPPSDATPSGRLRWSLSLQALAGGLSLAALLALAAWALWYGLTGIGEAAGATDPLAAAWCIGLALAALATGARILGWLWSPLPRPAGIPLERSEAPELHELLDDLRRRFAIGRSLRVRITGEMNASVAPRPGSLTLQIGLPLLLSVSPQQWLAIVSHELGHLVLQRSGPGAWAAHLRAWWYRVLQRITEDRSPPGRLLAWLLGPADRRYLQDGLQLSRAEEFEADALAAEAVGAAPLVDALYAVALKERFLSQDFLPKIHAQVYHRQQPSMLPYRQMASAFMVGYDPGEAHASVAEVAEDEAPTHPSIRSRMDRLAIADRPPARSTVSAAEAYLGAAVPRLAAVLDREWWSAHGHDWQRHHREVRWARRRIAQLVQRDGLAPARRLELTRLVESYCPDWDPAELYMDLLAEETVRAEAMLAVGRLLTDQGCEEGAVYLSAVLDQDSQVALAAARCLLEFCRRTGLDDLGDRAAGRLQDLEAAARTLDAEVRADPRGDGWAGAGLDPLSRYKLAKRIAAETAVRRAHLVRRSSAAHPGWQLFLLVLRTDAPPGSWLSSLARDLQPLLGDRGLISLLPVGPGSPLEQAAAAIPRTRLVPRRKPAEAR